MFFDSLEQLPIDPIFGLSSKFEADQRKEKVDLGIGFYRAEDLCAKPFEAILQAKKIFQKEAETAKYQAIEGNALFCNLAGNLIFGKDLFSKYKKSMAKVQSIGGTGALRLAGEFLYPLSNKELFLPDPTWTNHTSIFSKVGFSIHAYPYYCSKKKSLDFEAMHSFLSKAKERSILLLHASSHNPTGCDPSKEDWKEVLEICKKKKLFPLFDLAYQGFGEGLQKDAFPIRLFLKEEYSFAVCATYSKVFGLYRERVGALFFFCEDKKKSDIVLSHAKKLVRVSYSNPPYYGSRLISLILHSKKLSALWEKELEERRIRIQKLRGQLVDTLEKNHCPIDFSFIKNHKGIFSFCNLKREEVKQLITQYAVYLLDNGRINVSGLNKNNLDYVAKAICNVVQ